MGKNTRTILICSGKGGVGKTTLTANLGIALANSGATTAVLDADFGLRNLDLLKPKSASNTAESLRIFQRNFF